MYARSCVLVFKYVCWKACGDPLGWCVYVVMMIWCIFYYKVEVVITVSLIMIILPVISLPLLSWRCLQAVLLPDGPLPLYFHSLPLPTNTRQITHLVFKVYYGTGPSKFVFLDTLLRTVDQPYLIKSKHILFVTYTWLADVNASVAKCLCF